MKTIYAIAAVLCVTKKNKPTFKVETMNIELFEPKDERFEPSCTLSEIFQPMVPAFLFVCGVVIGAALVLIYLSMVRI
jgi:hypothetical protein